MWIFPWNSKSRGARALAEELGAFVIKQENSRFLGRPNKVVVNWGATEVPDEVHKSTVLNPPIRLRFVTDKLKFLRLVSRHARTPDWTDDKLVAREWQKDGYSVVCRDILNGHGGVGIRLRHKGDYLPLAPLYTRYVPKMSEFRLHFVGGKVVDIQRKAARRDTPQEQINWQIRNLAGGFIYSRANVVCPRDCIEQATIAFNKSGLHFGAVDVIWNQKQKKAYVLEINSAPGLEGRTVELYAEGLRSLEHEMLHL